ncbi:MAG: methionine--tRNA ligase, partial [Acidobacteria bacterium]
MMARFYLTTAIDYVNSRPHLGTAYEKVTADVIARYRRLCGFSTHFLMGNDEHSQNVYQRALELGLEPRVYCDQMEQVFRDVWAKLAVSFDDFIRTTEERHRVAVTTLVQRIADAGDLYEGEYEGWYCVSCEAFKPDKDLVDGNCSIHQTRPEWIKEKNHFFRLSKYRDRLLQHYEANPTFLQPDARRNEMLRLLEGGLEDISVSRTGQSWGIPLPSDPSSVVYVWFDALINYIAAVGYGTDDERFRRWWPADLHVVGKDITRFHAVVWPAMLMSAGLALPRRVFGHGWVNWQGQRMSKSLGTSVDPLDAADRLGPDPLRLYLVKEIAYGHDGDFTWERFEERYNADLANNFGNLVNRVAVMAHKYRGGRLAPVPGATPQLADRAADVVRRYQAAMDEYQLHIGMAAAFDLIDATNEFITRSEPWVLARTPDRRAELDQALFEMAEAVRIAAILLWPVMPASCAEILRRMGQVGPISEIRFDRDTAWAGGERQIVKGPPLWPRIEAPGAVAAARGGVTASTGAGDTMTDETEPAAASPPQEDGMAPAGGTAETTTAAGPAEAPRVSFDDFMRIELRVAKVLAAEPIPKSKKLLKVTVDTGSGERTIVAGIARSYTPETLIGRSVVIVANLE